MEISCINCYEGECYDNDNPVDDGSGDGAVTKVPSHIDIISKQVYNTGHAWISGDGPAGTNVNGTVDQQCPWLHSDLYAYLQNVVFALLPQQLQDVAIEKCMLIEQRYSSSSSTITSATGECWQTIGKLWVPNEVEAFGSVSSSSSTYGNYGIQYETFNSASKRTRYKPTSSSSSFWWLLSPRNDSYYNRALGVGTTGNVYTNEYAYVSNPFLICIRLQLS